MSDKQTTKVSETPAGQKPGNDGGKCQIQNCTCSNFVGNVTKNCENTSCMHAHSDHA
ncbi:hypothetical protein AN958_09626 [Leucoagaricus sp. SymC.cos]|nr:hypothetical protein AN958_09626 [Leucoagaricus sp. SymC.cos]